MLIGVVEPADVEVDKDDFSDDWVDVCASVVCNVEAAVDKCGVVEDFVDVAVEDRLLVLLVTEGVEPHTPQYLLQ